MNQLAARVAGRLDRLLAPLQQALRVGERPVFLDVRRGGKEEDLGLDVFGAQLARRDLRRVEPERRRLDLHHVAHDQPLQFRERAPLEPRVRRADRRVLAHHEQPFQFSIGHVQPVAEVRMVAGDPRQPAEAEVVLLRRRVAVLRLQQRDDVLVDVVPPARRQLVRLRCTRASVAVVRVELRHRRGSRAGCRTASGCRSSPGSTRGRAAP